MHNGFPNGWITPTITNYALCIMNYIVVGFDDKKRGRIKIEKSILIHPHILTIDSYFVYVTDLQ